MKQFFILNLLFFYCLSCSTDGPIKPPKSMEGVWKNPTSEQIMVFTKEGDGQMILKQQDTFSFKYKYNPQTEPAHLDWVEFDRDSPLRGLNIFGIVQFSHRDTFLFSSKKGREGEAEKSRPTGFAGKKALYIRQ